MKNTISIRFILNWRMEHIDIDVSDFVSGELENVLSDHKERYTVTRGRLQLNLQDLKPLVLKAVKPVRKRILLRMSR